MNINRFKLGYTNYWAMEVENYYVSMKMVNTILMRTP